ncbi:MAG: DnaJ C-terminal domain-containing protein [Planctomycetota bacterium]
MAVKFQDYYTVLGVSRTASADEIRSAYRKLARSKHPDVDRTDGATARFAQIAEAYEVLKDPQKRKRFDSLGEHWKDGQEFTPPPGWQGFDFRGARRGADGAGSFEFGDLGGFSAFFESMFGGGGDPSGGGAARARGAARPRAGETYEARVELTLDTLLAGAKQTLALEGGRTYEVKIPPGTTEGGTIRLRGQGAAGRSGGASGDLLLRVSIAPHPTFRVEEFDLHAQLAVSPWEAALGAKAELAMPDGRKAVVAVPAGSSSGRKLRLRGLGLPRTASERGDLIVEIAIAVPPALTDRERELFQELAKSSKFDPRA